MSLASSYSLCDSDYPYRDSSYSFCDRIYPHL